jgi:hypothetical protein
MPRPLFYQAEKAELLECFQVWFILMMTGDDDDDEEEFASFLQLSIGFLALLGMERPEICSTPRQYLTFDKVAHHDMQGLYRFDYCGLQRMMIALQIPDLQNRLQNRCSVQARGGPATTLNSLS